MEQIDGFKYYEATPFQKGIYLKYLVAPNKINPLNITVNKKVKDIDLNIIKETLKSIVHRHEILRTSLIHEGGRLKQKVWTFNESLIDIEIIDLSNEIDGNEKLNEIMKLAKETLFSPIKAPWIKFKIIKQSDFEYNINLIIHHFISDAESMKIILNELLIIYKYLKQSQHVILASPYQFGEYVNECYEIFNSKKGLNHKSFWSSILKDIPTKNLSTMFSYNNICREKSYSKFIRNELLEEFGVLDNEIINRFMGNVSFIRPKKGNSIDLFISRRHVSMLTEFSSEAKVSVQITVIALFQLLIFKLTGEKESIIGINTNLRDKEKHKNTIGFLINTLLLRHQIKSNQNITDFLSDLNISYIKTLRHKNYTFDQALYDSDVSLEQVGSLFFNILKKDESVDEINHLDEIIHKSEKCNPYFDIDLHVFIYNNTIKINCQYKTEFFHSSSIEFILAEYLKLIDSIYNINGQLLNKLLKSSNVLNSNT